MVSALPTKYRGQPRPGRYVCYTPETLDPNGCVTGEANEESTGSGSICALYVITFTGCNAGHTFFHVDPHGRASICRVGRDEQISLVDERRGPGPDGGHRHLERTRQIELTWMLSVIAIYNGPANMAGVSTSG